MNSVVGMPLTKMETVADVRHPIIHFIHLEQNHSLLIICDRNDIDDSYDSDDIDRDLSRIWLHVDMDAFYAAVETLSNPTLKGKPMAVGSMSMISTANYEVYYDLDIVSVLSAGYLNHGIPDPHLVFT